MTDARDAKQRELLIAMCKAHDREDAAQKGEPSPWEVYVDEIGEDWIEERVAAMREALSALQAAGWTITRPEPSERMKVAGGLHLEKELFEDPKDDLIFDAAGRTFTAMLSASEEPQ